jgi:hypothetical protein
MATHRVKFNCIHYVIVRFQVDRFLKLVFWIQAPQLHGSVRRGSRNVGSINVDLTSHGVEADVDDAVSVTFELCTQLAVGDTPHFAVTTPPTCRKKIFIWGETASANTPVISILRLGHCVVANPVCDSL